MTLPKSKLPAKPSNGFQTKILDKAFSLLSHFSPADQIRISWLKDDQLAALAAQSIWMVAAEDNSFINHLSTSIGRIRIGESVLPGAATKETGTQQDFKYIKEQYRELNLDKPPTRSTLHNPSYSKTFKPNGLSRKDIAGNQGDFSDE